MPAVAVKASFAESYTSAPLLVPHPPKRMAKTLPLGSRLADTVARPESRANAGGPVRANWPLTGSYNSGFGSALSLQTSPPPSNNTLPFGSNTETGPPLAAGLPVGVNAPVRGSYNSALLGTPGAAALSPPVIKTLPV